MSSFLDGRPKIAFYGDDFTGATDTLATATLAGLRSLLFLHVPDAAQLSAAGRLDCLGIAGAARSMDEAQMRAELEPVSAFFSSLRAPVTHYKICSTFDSAPHIGNIGAALRIWRARIANRFVPIVGGQPNLRRYCLFSQLYAAEKAGGEVVRIDRHPTMRQHPVTPMDEADLRIHLQRQGLQVAGLHYPCYADAQALQAQIDAALEAHSDAVLFDVSAAADLNAIGRAIWRSAEQQDLLAIGASSVVQSLAAYWHGEGWLGQEGEQAEQASQEARIAPARGPVFVLAGSLSPITEQQVSAAQAYDRLLLDAQRLCEGDEAYLAATVTRIAQGLRSGRNMLACTSAPVEERQLLAGEGAAQRLAMACGELLRRVLQATPLSRVGVAGGDTSSHALRALDIWGLSYVGQLSAGVALCRAHAQEPHLDGVELMLKGGQMGPAELFELLLHGT
ncbi:four-carbon acid sugar kinase family protein [Herbaspirillum sp. LeCh32-8]|uniref:four-carbon acid sugar kinase family protein n=1 Tax=Herbaspirillum sp. LeCh32-8 TaxID=2821356 RepID=UPI001AE3FAA6|nr:four-carbon acid sugar kinase family protein [Herbaspirillum sp. LeCh32-8]MBP0598741.1 four-carbon acid sugar kinase family protein [Herbaspirillum sp. LeCh32-8]